MLGPTGLDRFAERFPDRTYDVGIAEQHAATSAAAMAYGGLHPVVALYATFLNRAFDQVLMDCALHRAGVTFVLDRAGITGDDGPSHNGMWDMAMLHFVPGLRIAAPRDEPTLRLALREAVAVGDAPTVVRFPKGALGPVVPAARQAHGCDVIAESGRPDVVIVAVGAFAGLGIEVAHRLKAQGIGVVVLDPRWVKPLPTELIDAAARARLVVCLEDGVRSGGVGDGLGAMLRDAGVWVPVRVVGVPERFLAHGKRSQVLAECGLTAQEVSLDIVETMARWAETTETTDTTGATDVGGPAPSVNGRRAVGQAETSQATTSGADQPAG